VNKSSASGVAVLRTLKQQMKTIIAIALLCTTAQAQTPTARALQGEINELHKQIQVEEIKRDGLTQRFKIFRKEVTDVFAKFLDTQQAMEKQITALQQQMNTLNASMKRMEAQVRAYPRTRQRVNLR
jgi:uncharacterized protein involved in exopolysaccharide biosynthesis